MGYKFFKNANLIDGNGGDVGENVSVLVENDRIKEISNSQSVPSYAEEVIDCKGNTLMPGLIDAHLHLGLVEIEVINLARRNAPGLMAARMFKNLKEALQCRLQSSPLLCMNEAPSTVAILSSAGAHLSTPGQGPTGGGAGCIAHYCRYLSWRPVT